MQGTYALCCLSSVELQRTEVPVMSLCFSALISGGSAGIRALGGSTLSS